MHFTLLAKRLLPIGCLSICLSAPALHAQALPSGVHFGMTIDELQAVQPAVQRVIKPQHLAGGLSGNLRGDPVVVAGLPFDLTFFFADRKLRRIEFLASVQPQTDSGTTAFKAIVEWGRGVFGPESGSSDPSGKYAAWVAGDVDVYAQSASSPLRENVRLVYKAQEHRDDRNL